MKVYSGFMAGVLFIGACTSVEKSELKSVQVLQYENSALLPQLVINEYDPKGTLVNESGEESDWIELYNPTDSVIHISAGTWFLSDDYKEPEKFALPEMEVAAHAFVLILCDGKKGGEGSIHANFKISAENETIRLYHQRVLMDEVNCDTELKKKFSFGRLSDGEWVWTEQKAPSPGRSNNSADYYVESSQ